jgi:hypothetical protein
MLDWLSYRDSLIYQHAENRSVGRAKCLTICDGSRQRGARDLPAPAPIRITYCVERWAIENSLPGFKELAIEHGMRRL